MKRFWTALAVVLLSIAGAAGCNDYGNTFQVPTGAQISSISPSAISAGSPDFTITVTGFGFVAQTVVQWNQKNIKTNVQTDSNGNVLSVTATVPAALVAKSGLNFVETLNPFSGAGNNGLSNPLPFIVNPQPNPVPAVSSISPNITPAGSGSLSMTISGSNFLPTSDPSGGSQVNWNMGATQTTLANPTISATSIQVTVPSSLLVTAGCAIVSVYNAPAQQITPPGGIPNPSGGGGGTSANAPTFTIGTAGSCPSAQNATASNSSVSVAEETPTVSADGRYVGFAASQNDHIQVFLRDTCEGAPSGCEQSSSLLSVAPDGSPGNDDSRTPSMSSDGRYVAFSSAATNLTTEGGAAPGRQIYLRDTCLGTKNATCTSSTQLVSTDSNGSLVGTEGIMPSVSSSGRFVAFLAVTRSNAAGLAGPQAQSKAGTPELNSGYRQVFVRDMCLGASNCTPKTTRISLQPSDTSAAPNGKTAGPALSGAATHVALSGAINATVFTRSVAVDDRIFLAVLSIHP